MLFLKNQTMAIHDWSRIGAETFLAFHTNWIGRLMEALNQCLPEGFYALAEQHAGTMIALPRHAPRLARRDRGPSRTGLGLIVSSGERSAPVCIIVPDGSMPS